MPLEQGTSNSTTSPVPKRELRMELARAVGAELRLLDDQTPEDRARAAFAAYGKLLQALAADVPVPCDIRTVLSLLTRLDEDLVVEGESFRAQVAPSRLLAAAYGCDRVTLVPLVHAIELNRPQPGRLAALINLFPQLEQIPTGARIPLPQVPGGAD